MRTKKEYLILAIIIIAAGLYLVFHKDDQTQYQLPVISKIEIDSVTRMEIRSTEETIALEKKGGQWLIAPHDYPADEAKIKGMLFEIEDIVLTDLVSESKTYVRYQLDDEKKIALKAWAGDTLVRAFDIGKEAATFQHTFVRMPDDPNVYHARGDFRRKFATDADQLRDREVLAFDPDALQKIQVTSGPDMLLLTRSTPPAQDKSQAEKEAGKQPAGTPRPVWQTPDGQKADAATLEGFLSDINNLMCANYLEGRQKDEFTDPVFEIALDGKQAYTLAVFKKADEKATEAPAISSYNAYPFTLSIDRLERLKETVGKLAGKKAPAEEK